MTLSCDSAVCLLASDVRKPVISRRWSGSFWRRVFWYTTNRFLFRYDHTGFLNGWSAAAQTHRSGGGRSSQHIIHYLWTLVCRHRTDCNRETQSKEQRTGDQASRGPECFIIIFIKRNYYLVIIYPAWSTDGCSGRRCACCCCSPHVCSWRTSAGPAEGNCNIWEWVPINQLSDNRYFLTVYHLTWSGLLASCLKSAL